MKTTARSRPLVSTLLFFGVPLAQLFLWRASLFAMPLPEQPPAVLAELACWAVMGALALFTANRRGLTTQAQRWTALSGVALYALFNIAHLSLFASLNLAGLKDGSDIYGPALVVLKLFAVLTAVIAAIPVAPTVRGEEYADRLLAAARRQRAEWALAEAKGTRKDLERTLEDLRGKIPPEEFDVLLKEFQSTASRPPSDGGEEPR